jgi:hypothetical protein
MPHSTLRKMGGARGADITPCAMRAKRDEIPRSTRRLNQNVISRSQPHRAATHYDSQKLQLGHSLVAHYKETMPMLKKSTKPTERS